MATMSYNYGSSRGQGSQYGSSNYYREERKTNLMNIGSQALGRGGATSNSVYGNPGPIGSGIPMNREYGGRAPVYGAGYNDYQGGSRREMDQGSQFGSKYNNPRNGPIPSQQDQTTAESSLKLIRAKMRSTEANLPNQQPEYGRNNRTADTFSTKGNYDYGNQQQGYQGNNGPSSVNSNYGKKFVPERIIDKETNNIESELRSLENDLNNSKQRQIARINNSSRVQQPEPFPNNRRLNGIGSGPAMRGGHGMAPGYQQSPVYEEIESKHVSKTPMASSQSRNPPFQAPRPQMNHNGEQQNSSNQYKAIGAQHLKGRAPYPPRKPEPESEEEEESENQNEEDDEVASQGDPGELIECTEGCGRKFNRKALKKHRQVCKKVFQQKRKKFNSKEKREVSDEQEQLERANRRIQQTIDKKKKLQKSKWKKDSQAFQAQIRMARGEKLTANEKMSIQEAGEEEMIRCPTCGRKFNQTAGERHIKFCSAKAKQNNMRNGPPKKGGNRLY